MAFWVYILRSETTGRYYCGQTDNVEKRLQQHNDPQNTFTQTTTRFTGPWRLVYRTNCQSRTEAIRLERRIKKRGIGRFLSDLKQAGGC